MTRAAAQPGVVADRHRRRRPGRAGPGPDLRATGRCSSPRARRPGTSATCWRRSPRRAGHAAREAAALVEVDYEVLRAGHRSDRGAPPDDAPPVQTRGNLLATTTIRRGDVDGALAIAAHVVTETFRTQRIEHAFLEPEACLAVPEPRTDGRPRLRGLLAGPGRLGGPAPDRVAARPAGAATSASPRSRPAAGSAARRTSASRAMPRCLAWLTGRPVLLALSRRESLRFHPKRHPLVMDYTAGCDADGRLLGGPGPDRRRHRRLRQRRRQGPRARGGSCLRRLPRAERRRRGADGLHEQPAGRRDARLRRAAGRLRDRGDARPPRRAGRDRRLGDPLAQRARGRRPVRDRPEAGPGRRAQGRRCSPSATPTDAAPIAGIACGAKNAGIGNGMRERGRAILRPGGRRHGHAVPLVDRDGPGHPHRPRARSSRRARRSRSTGSTSWSTPSASSTPARRPRRGRRRSAGRPCSTPRAGSATELAGRPLSGLAGREFAGRVTRRLDDRAGQRRRRARHPLRLRLGDPGRDPRRRGPAERVIAAQDVGRAINPPSSRARSRAASTWGSAWP